MISPSNRNVSRLFKQVRYVRHVWLDLWCSIFGEEKSDDSSFVGVDATVVALHEIRTFAETLT